MLIHGPKNQLSEEICFLEASAEGGPLGGVRHLRPVTLNQAVLQGVAFTGVQVLR